MMYLRKRSRQFSRLEEGEEEDSLRVVPPIALIASLLGGERTGKDFIVLRKGEDEGQYHSFEAEQEATDAPRSGGGAAIPYR